MHPVCFTPLGAGIRNDKPGDFLMIGIEIGEI